MKVKVQEYLRDPDTQENVWATAYEKETELRSDVQDELDFFFELGERFFGPVRIVIES